MNTVIIDSNNTTTITNDTFYKKRIFNKYERKENGYIRVLFKHRLIPHKNMSGLMHVIAEMIQLSLNNGIKDYDRRGTVLSVLVHSKMCELDIEVVLRLTNKHHNYNKDDMYMINLLSSSIIPDILIGYHGVLDSVPDAVAKANLTSYLYKHKKTHVVDQYMNKYFGNSAPDNYLYEYSGISEEVVSDLVNCIYSNDYLELCEIESNDDKLIDKLSNTITRAINKIKIKPDHADLYKPELPCVDKDDDTIIVNQLFRYNACIVEFNRKFPLIATKYQINKTALMYFMFHFIFVHNNVFKTASEIAIMKYKFDKKGVEEYLLKMKGLFRKEKDITIFDTSLIRPDKAKDIVKSLKKCISVKIDSMNDEAFNKYIKIVNYNLEKSYNYKTYPVVNLEYINTVGTYINQDIIHDISLDEFKKFAKAVLNDMNISFISQDN